MRLTTTSVDARNSMGLMLALGLACVPTLTGCGAGAVSESPSPATETRELDETHLKFGQVARFQSRAGSSDVPLEVTVAAPKSFTPAKDASFFYARSSAGAIKGKRYANNIVFSVTVKNASKDEAYEPLIVPDVHVADAADDEVSNVLQDGWEGPTGEIPPGRSVTFKDAYSLQSTEDLEYRLALDGLAGRTYYFK